jgi:hypothetical protein
MECIGRSRCQAATADCAGMWPRRHELRRNQGAWGAPVSRCIRPGVRTTAAAATSDGLHAQEAGTRALHMHSASARLQSRASRLANGPVVALPSMPTPLWRSVRLVASEPRGDGGARPARHEPRIGLLSKGVDWRVRYGRLQRARMRVVWVMVRAGLTGWCRPLR